MKYEGMIIRPPSEAGSLLLQVSVGCSHNKCTFCPTYKGEKFRIKSFEEIREDIREAARLSQRRPIGKVFLVGGDALILPQPRLVEILTELRDNIRGIRRVGLYANAKSVRKKTPEQLKELHDLGLGIAYLGVESGSASVLEKIRKGATPQQLVDAGQKLKEAGISLSVTVLLGIGGEEGSTEHALSTANILTEMDPDYTGALTLMLVPGTPLHDDWKAGRFILPDQYGFLEELGIMIGRSRFTNCFFTSNHASNYLPIRARLPEEKEATVQLIREVVESRDRKLLRPEYLRGL
ncbi:MAG TPA: radical SAM protein [Syntrophales bacterium]|nr:radical SAM protein [Syntrophales bacterium]